MTTLQTVEAKFSTVAGEPVEITVRDINEFTFSTWSLIGAEKIAAFFSGQNLRVLHDDECGSFVYLTVDLSLCI